jgi:hypothetical protein
MTKKGPKYEAALVQANINAKACYERCKEFVTNPNVLAALATPVTMLRDIPDEDEEASA